MDIKSSGSAYKRIKGFTLVELIVVIAIIVILAGITNLVTQSFVKNARTETANDKARLVFTGFQNILTQCEIKQDNSAISPKIESNAVVNDSSLKRIIIEFKCYDGNIQCCKVTGSTGTGSTGTAVESKYNNHYTGSMLKYNDGGTKGSSKLPNAIAGIIDSSFEGEAKVYIDYENYEVESVVYRQLSDSDKNQTTYVINDSNLTHYGWYCGYADRQDQDAKYKSSGILYGAYPFQRDLGLVAS